MITEDYVSFETAKLLKEKGFDWECRDYYNTDGHFYSEDFKSNWNYGGGTITMFSAPTLQMATKWLREVHKLHIVILWDCGAYTGNNSFYYHIDRINNYEDKGYNKIGFGSNEETCEAAIKYCLENLI